MPLTELKIAGITIDHCIQLRGLAYMVCGRIERFRSFTVERQMRARERQAEREHDRTWRRWNSREEIERRSSGPRRIECDPMGFTMMCGRGCDGSYDELHRIAEKD